MDFNLENTCRICLNNSAAHNIFMAKRTHISKKVSCYEMINVMFCISGSQKDGLPQKVCRKCYMRIYSNYKFRILAEDSNKTLLEHFSGCDIKNIGEKYEIDIEFKSESIKDEVVSESNDSINNDDTSIWKLEEDCDYNIPLKDLNKCSVVLEKPDFEEKYESNDLANFDDEHKDDGDYLVSLQNVDKATELVKKKAPVKKKTDYKAGRNHQRMYHSGFVLEKRFACTLCDRKFGIKSHLTIHMTTHTQEKAYKCELCDKFYKTRTACNSHRKEVHEGLREHVCHYCSKAFYLRTGLKFHLISHTKENNYKCEECGKMFRTPMSLKGHKKLHASIKNVKCKLCDSVFYNAGGLRSHMLSHTKEKKHPCKYCGIMFGRTDHRNRHQKTAHEDKLK